MMQIYDELKKSLSRKSVIKNLNLNNCKLILMFIFVQKVNYE